MGGMNNNLMGGNSGIPTPNFGGNNIFNTGGINSNNNQNMMGMGIGMNNSNNFLGNNTGGGITIGGGTGGGFGGNSMFPSKQSFSFYIINFL